MKFGVTTIKRPIEININHFDFLFVHIVLSFLHLYALETRGGKMLQFQKKSLRSDKNLRSDF